MKKTITKEFYNKIAREHGILDTKTYRYVIINQSTVERIRAVVRAYRRNGRK